MGSGLAGRGWLEFFTWILILEWVLFGLVVLDLRARDVRLSTIGFPSFAGRERAIIVGIALALVAFVLAVGDSTSSRIVSAPWIVPRLAEEKLLMLLVAATAGICEETIFRGYLYHGLRGMRLGTWTAVILSTVSFVLIHGLEQPPVLLAFRTVAGLGFAGLYAWSGALKAPILVHAAIDAQLALSW